MDYVNELSQAFGGRTICNKLEEYKHKIVTTWLYLYKVLKTSQNVIWRPKLQLNRSFCSSITELVTILIKLVKNKQYNKKQCALYYCAITYG